MTERFDIRSLRESELEQAIGLADRTFRADLRRSMASSLPLVFSPAQLHGVGAFLEDRLVSFAGLVPSVVRIGEARVTLFSYGAVCTDESYRGRGLASRILQHALAYVRSADVSLLLVSGELPLYLQAGFRPYGEALRCMLRRPSTRGEAGGRSLDRDLRVVSAVAQDSLRLHRLASMRRVAFEQSVWDLAELIRAGSIAAIRDWQQEAYLVWRQGETEAMLVLAYGQVADGDRCGQVIEWAGPLETVIAAAEGLLGQLNLTELTLYVAGERHWIMREGTTWAATDGKESMAGALRYTQCATANAAMQLRAAPLDVMSCRNDGTLLVSRPDQLFQELEPYWRSLGLADAALPRLETQTDGRFVARVGGQATPALTLEELQLWLFGCAGESLPEALQRMGAIAATCFPVPLPYMKGLNFV